MVKVLFENTKVPIKLWLNDIEDGALQQAQNAANLPFIFNHLAVMPDAHQGYGICIGGVLATEGVVIPNAVGVDIGCGMCAIKTSLHIRNFTKDIQIKILDKIREVIPVGKKHQKEAQSKALMPNEINIRYVVEREYSSALKQLGTLGGGNHFIELQKDTNGCIWIMIHSGSRNLGKQVCDYYDKLAIYLNEKWHTKVPKEWQLAFLPLDSQEGQDYLREMQYCVDFALANRKLMMNRIIGILVDIVCNSVNEKADFMRYILDNEMINIAHNYASMEHHFGKDVMIHRKGATLAREGTIGIIPGSQGTKSYIVKGLGNPDSFESCSHGAGRTMSRTKAQANLNLAEEIKKLDDQGIIHGIRTVNDLDEASGAYKNIDEVMENQKDLVKILVELQPLAVIKG
jgi:tRNA-splicing ligase RtcB